MLMVHQCGSDIRAIRASVAGQRRRIYAAAPLDRLSGTEVALSVAGVLETGALSADGRRRCSRCTAARTYRKSRRGTPCTSTCLTRGLRCWRRLPEYWACAAEICGPANLVTLTQACPLLIVQGARDPRVPKAKSDQMVAQLRARGLAVEHLVIEDEGHGFTRRHNQLHVTRTVADYLVKHLVG